MFIWKDGQFYGSNVDALAEIYNDSLKTKKQLSPDAKYNILWKHNSLKDIKTLICSESAWDKMNDMQKTILFLCNLETMKM